MLRGSQIIQISILLCTTVPTIAQVQLSNLFAEDWDTPNYLSTLLSQSAQQSLVLDSMVITTWEESDTVGRASYVYEEYAPDGSGEVFTLTRYGIDVNGFPMQLLETSTQIIRRTSSTLFTSRIGSRSGNRFSNGPFNEKSYQKGFGTDTSYTTNYSYDLPQPPTSTVTPFAFVRAVRGDTTFTDSYRLVDSSDALQDGIVYLRESTAMFRPGLPDFSIRAFVEPSGDTSNLFRQEYRYTFDAQDRLVTTRTEDDPGFRAPTVQVDSIVYGPSLETVYTRRFGPELPEERSHVVRELQDELPVAEQHYTGFSSVPDSLLRETTYLYEGTAVLREISIDYFLGEDDPIGGTYTYLYPKRTVSTQTAPEHRCSFRATTTPGGIHVTSDRESSAMLLDYSGRQVWAGNTGADNTTVPADLLARGAYVFVRADGCAQTVVW